MEVLTPRPMGEGQKTLFVTFYSFKGGVGRTLALLNVACILAGLGRRVLMIDFDLEAPGLTLFQDKQRAEGASRKQLGLVDAIGDFLDDPWSSPLGDAEPSDFFDDYVSSLDIPEGVQKGEKEGTLDLVPAGRLDDDYESRMYDLNFEEMFEEGVGRPFFERLKDLIEDSGRYDYILIDSRTGFSDEGSISTRFLGDYLMVLTGLNRQNVRGTARFLRQANVAERDETLALVASPVPMYYEKLRAERIDAAKTHIAERAGLDEIQFVTQIPYHPVLALEEDPTVRSLDGTDLFESYEDITEHLRTWAGDRLEERIERVLTSARSGKTDEALSLFRKVREEDPEVALQFLRNFGTLLSESNPETAIDLVEEGIHIAQELNDLKSEERLFSFLLNGYIESGKTDQVTQVSDSHKKTGYSLIDLGNRYAERGNTKQAIDRYKRALELFQEIDHQSGEAGALHNLGNQCAVQGDVERAIDYHKSALRIFRREGNQRGEALALEGLGNRNAERGDLDCALERYKNALALYEETGSQFQEASILRSIGNCYGDCGELDRALEYLGQALDLFREMGNRKQEAIVLATLSVRRAQAGNEEEATSGIERAVEIADDLDLPSYRAVVYLDWVWTLSNFNFQRALEVLRNAWSLIQEHEDAFGKMKAHVLRARLRLETENDAEGAAEDAQKALDFYRERNVDSRWSHEAEEIFEEAQAHIE